MQTDLANLRTHTQRGMAVCTDGLVSAQHSCPSNALALGSGLTESKVTQERERNTASVKVVLLTQQFAQVGRLSLVSIFYLVHRAQADSAWTVSPRRPQESVGKTKADDQGQIF